MDIYIARGEDRNGPYSVDSIRQFLADGELDGTELAYHEGLDEWANVRDVIKEIPPSPVLRDLPAPLSPEIEQDMKEWSEKSRERYEEDKRRTIRKFKRPAFLISFGCIIYNIITQANHFGYPWYGWPANYISGSDAWHWYISGAKEPIITFALFIVGLGLYALGEWQKYID